MEWVFKRQGLPVEVIAEFETWRKVRDWEGTVGWVHQRMLSGRRYAVVIDAVQTMRGEPDDGAAAVALVEQGVVTKVTRCREGQSWCRVEAAVEPGYPCPKCQAMALLELAGAWWMCTNCGTLRTRWRRDDPRRFT